MRAITGLRGHRKFFATAEEELTLLIFFEGDARRTIDQAAEHFGCSRETINLTLRRIRVRAKEKAPPAETGEPVFQDPLSGAAERNTDRTRSTTMGAPSPKEKSA
jgi:hypothetical protein